MIELGQEAERVSDGAFSIKLPTDGSGDGRRRLDPSGVVKGWAAQRASRFLAALDDTDFCLSAGGDMVCHTADPSRADWRIGIEHPRDPNTLIAACPSAPGPSPPLAPPTAAPISSTRAPVETPSGVASVTVIAASLTWADIDATAAYVQGHDAARWLQTRPIRSALVVWADGTTTRLPKDPSNSYID